MLNLQKYSDKDKVQLCKGHHKKKNIALEAMDARDQYQQDSIIQLSQYSTPIKLEMMVAYSSVKANGMIQKNYTQVHESQFRLESYRKLRMHRIEEGSLAKSHYNASLIKRDIGRWVLRAEPGLVAQTQTAKLRHGLLDIESNRIEDQSCLFLSRGKWKNLRQLNLRFNQIGQSGCNYLSRGLWKHLAQLELGNNLVDEAGCRDLGKAPWPLLCEINLRNNCISYQSNLLQAMESVFYQNFLRLRF